MRTATSGCGFRFVASASRACCMSVCMRGSPTPYSAARVRASRSCSGSLSHSACTASSVGFSISLASTTSVPFVSFSSSRRFALSDARYSFSYLKTTLWALRPFSVTLPNPSRMAALSTSNDSSIIHNCSEFMARLRMPSTTLRTLVLQFMSNACMRSLSCLTRSGVRPLMTLAVLAATRLRLCRLLRLRLLRIDLHLGVLEPHGQVIRVGPHFRLLDPIEDGVHCLRRIIGLSGIRHGTHEHRRGHLVAHLNLRFGPVHGARACVVWRGACVPRPFKSIQRHKPQEGRYAGGDGIGRGVWTAHQGGPPSRAVRSCSAVNTPLFRKV